jgi:hypothetical protein
VTYFQNLQGCSKIGKDQWSGGNMADLFDIMGITLELKPSRENRSLEEFI